MSDQSTTPNIVPVILCGGSGTRLWPRSRKDRPKPFLPLIGDSSLFEQTVARFAETPGFAAPIVVAGAAHQSLIEEQLGGQSGARIVIEPAARNTAPAIALAAQMLDPDDIMLVCPSDHHIAKPEAFRTAARTAANLAMSGWLVSLGITPERAETGYGYLHRGEVLDAGFRVERFVEKPDQARAEEFLADGNYLWNAGIFAFAAGRFLEELALHNPAMARGAAEAMAASTTDGRVTRPSASPFEAIEGDSIDYAVMEKTDQAALVEADIGWSDIGNWQALRDARDSDEDGNVTVGPVELLESSNVMVQSDGPRVSVVGLDDVIVVVDGDEVLVTSAKGAQSVGKLGGARGK